MPGIVVFKRRWSVGSDDLVVPAAFLVVLHLVWIVALSVILGTVHFDLSEDCNQPLRTHVLGYVVILACCLLVEGIAVVVSTRGTILNTEPRVILIVELAWLIIGVIWFSQHYKSCSASPAKSAILGIIVCNWVIMLSVMLSLWCTFDTAGRSWVKMKRYQESVKEREQRRGHQKRRSGSARRNWRNRKFHSVPSVERATRKAMRAYEQSWDRRCNFLFCCVKEDRHRNSFTEVAKLFTEFFRDLDVVPTDIVAGLVLLRKHQKTRRRVIVSQGTNEVYQFLSGVPIFPSTKFLSLKNPDITVEYKKVVHYMRYALAAYGWPMFMMMNTGTGFCKIMPHLKCCCCCQCCCRDNDQSVLVEDNCCQCNYAAMRRMSGLRKLDIVYVTYHVDIGETPFFVAVDHDHKTVVISIRGTLSLQDVLTDLKADAELVPVDPPKEDWLAHKGMVQAAVYIRKKIKDEMLLSKAFGKDLDQGTQGYELAIVGHSLGAGTAAILAILLHQEYPNLHCYAYSPPGGLLSAICVEETKSFITSVVVGKDVVPRIGLHQLEALRNDLINVIKKSTMSKWRIIGGSMACCGGGDKHDLTGSQMEMYELMKQEKETRYFLHPSDSQINLTSHTPLFLPGRIIHVVRNHPKNPGRLCGSAEPVYQAIWADNKDFDEVLISPTMINDHMPDNVMEALEKVLTNVSPAKPTRRLPEAERRALLSNSDQTTPPPHRLCLETSFTNLSPPEIEDLNRSSGGYSLGSDANSLSWDYATIGPGTMIGGRQLPLEATPPTRATHSFPSRPQPNFKLDLSKDDWLGMAPLATPETMSETSSLYSLESRGSKRLSNGYHRLQGPPMDPIQQSPQHCARAEGYCYGMEPPSPVDYADAPETHKQPPISHMLPLAQSTPIKAGELGGAGDVGASIPSPHGEQGERPHGEQGDVTGDSSLDLTAKEQQIQGKIDAIEAGEPYKLTYHSGTVGTDSYVRHSPDSLSTCNQLMYDEHVGHYSPAGRGYPHGGYMPCSDSKDGEDRGDSDWERESGVDVLPDSDEITKNNNESSHLDDCKVTANGDGWNGALLPGTAVTITEPSLDSRMTTAPLVRSVDWMPAMNGIHTTSPATENHPTPV